MARKGQTPATPVEQKPVDPAPPAQDQGAGAPSIEEAAQPPVEPEPAPAPEPAVPPVQPAPADVEPLAIYAARIEEEAQPLPVCQITHPEAKDGAVHVGKYAGIRLKHGAAPAALLSDGRVI